MGRFMKVHKRHLTLAVKAVFVVALLYFLGQKGFLSLEATARAFSHPGLILGGVFFYFCNVLLCMFRWQALLRTQGIRLSFSRVAELTLIGGFFNLALPGAVSGDVVKAVYVGKVAQGFRARAFSSIFFDRVMGMTGLVIVSLIGLWVAYAYGISGRVPHPVQLASLGLGLGAFLGFSYLLFLKERHDPILKLLKTLERKNAKFDSLTRIYLGLREYHSARKTLIGVLLLSILVHTFAVATAYQFSLALGIQDFPFLGLIIAVPLGLLVTAVPVLPGGLGTGHAAFSALYLMFGSDRGADVFNLIFLTQALVGAIGGVVYLRFKSENAGVVFETMRADEAPEGFPKARP